MSLYRVSLLDPEGVVAHSRTTDSIRGAAALLVALGACTGEDWAKPLLDELGEFTANVTGEGGRVLTHEEGVQLLHHVEAFGAVTPTDDSELGRLRWHNPERRT